MTSIAAQVPRLFNIEVARGAITGYEHVVIVGVNPAVSKTFEDLWDVGGNFSFPTAGETWEILSSSASDTSAGTGARTVLISGLDDSYVEQTETVTMNGTSAVTTARTDWFRIRSVIVTSCGSGQTNAGDITIRVSGGGASRSLILTGNGQTFNGFFTVPAGKTLLVQFSQVVIPKNEDVTLQSQVLIDGTNAFVSGAQLAVYQNNLSTVFTSIPTIPEKTDFRLTAKSTNTTVTVSQLVEGILANQTGMSSSVRSF